MEENMSGNNELSPKLVEILEMSDKLLDAIDSLRCDDNRIPWKIFNSESINRNEDQIRMICEISIIEKTIRKSQYVICKN